MKKKENVLVIGAGSWGTSISNHIAQNENQVFLLASKEEVVCEINTKRSNQKFLPSIKLSKNITALVDFKTDVDFVFIVTPSRNAKEVFQKIAKTNFKKTCIFVICSKGIETSSLSLLSDSFEKITGRKNYAVLSGPNFALEVAQEEPTVTSIASFDKKIAQKVINLLNNSNFKASFFNDPRTAEICGVIKNIIAIACGIAEGLALGENTKAALVLRGALEIQLLCRKIKASENILNAAGLGDIFLTCSSSKSRNHSLGILLVQKKSLGKFPKKESTYEGISSANSVVAMAKKLKLKLDLCEAVQQILSHEFSTKEIKRIISAAALA